MNNVNEIGRLTRDPELSYAKNGKALVKFSIAVDRAFNRDVTDFFDVIAWGKTAELISKHFSKGSQIAFSGRLQQDRWEAKDGGKRSKVVLVAEQITFVGSKNDDVF